LKEVSFLGNIIYEGGISVDPSKVKDVLSWNTPQNILDIRSFLGLTRYYRRFIEGLSKISKSMIELLENGKTFEWTPRREASFQELKKTYYGPSLNYARHGEAILDILRCIPSRFRMCTDAK
jgi:hypothetical protein